MARGTAGVISGWERQLRILMTGLERSARICNRSKGCWKSEWISKRARKIKEARKEFHKTAKAKMWGPEGYLS